MIPVELREQLTRLAFQSISHGLEHQCALPVAVDDWPMEMHESRASFVTLYKHDELRGCVGGLVATLPLVQDVSEHAYATAFKDPRFDPVTRVELDALHIHLSVLSSPEPVICGSESELLEMITPGLDGLVLKEGHRQGTFLPAVWEKLPDPRQFLVQLKQKAGLAPDYWSDTLSIERYTTESW